MAIWFIIPAIAALVAAIAAIIKIFEGKKLAVLGESRVGKTVLINFLTKGTLSEAYVRTLYPKKTDANDLELKDLKLSIEESIDVPGRDDFYPDWKKLSRDADVILYLLRADKLQAGDKHTEERVKQDIGQIGKWLKESPKEFPLFILGTHCDLITPDLTSLPENKIGDYENELLRMPVFQEIALRGGGGSKVRFVFGSLKSKDTTERLVYQIIDQVVNHNG